MKRKAPKCNRCHVLMKIGKALQNPPISFPDFAGDTGRERGCTVSADTLRIVMIDCWKCPKCGKSLSIPLKNKQLNGYPVACETHHPNPCDCRH